MNSTSHSIPYVPQPRASFIVRALRLAHDEVAIEDGPQSYLAPTWRVPDIACLMGLARRAQRSP